MVRIAVAADADGDLHLVAAPFVEVLPCSCWLAQLRDPSESFVSRKRHVEPGGACAVAVRVYNLAQAPPPNQLGKLAVTNATSRRTLPSIPVQRAFVLDKGPSRCIAKGIFSFVSC